MTSLFAELSSHPILFQRRNCPHEIMESVNWPPFRNSPNHSSPVAFYFIKNQNQENEV